MRVAAQRHLLRCFKIQSESSEHVDEPKSSCRFIQTDFRATFSQPRGKRGRPAAQWTQGPPARLWGPSPLDLCPRLSGEAEAWAWARCQASSSAVPVPCSRQQCAGHSVADGKSISGSWVPGTLGWSFPQATPCSPAVSAHSPCPPATLRLLGGAW